MPAEMLQIQAICHQIGVPVRIHNRRSHIEERRGTGGPILLLGRTTNPYGLSR